MSKVFEFLGDELENKEGEKKKVQTIRGDGKVIALYFSAHWCPPCRGFTPKLAQFYKKAKDSSNGDKFELVFVSSDKGTGEFTEYLSEMPWWALPFERRTEKAKLSSYFNVSGIPTLILLDGASGKVINKNGRAIVGSDPEAKNFPWAAKKLHDILKEGEYINNSQEKKTFEQDLKGKVLGLYFSAHWCPPCQAFTPKLSETYKLLKDQKKPFEVIFASADQNEAAFMSYFKEMPFLALPFDSGVKEELNEFFEIEGIPMLIIVDEDGKVITSNGRAAIADDKEGKKFPWIPDPVKELDSECGPQLNEGPCLVYLPGDVQEGFEQMMALLKPIGQESQRLAKEEDRNPDLEFLVAKSGENAMVRNLCQFIHVEPDEESLFILDINSMKIFKAEKQQFTKEVVEQFVKDYRGDKLEGKSFKPEEQE